MVKNIKYILLICGLSMVKAASGSHMAGADITYFSLGSGKYKIVAKIYRDCRGTPFNNPTFKAFAGLNGSDSCGSYTLSIARTAINDVTPKCSTSSKPCNPINTGFTGEGLEEHVYEATVDFNAAPLNTFLNNSSCCEVTFAIGQCCRNGAITTGSANEDFWVTCMINLCNVNKTKKKSNSGPLFSNVPIGFLCCNQEYKFNNGAIDTIDYDSMSTRLVYGLKALPKTSITYKSPFTLRYPMTPFCIPIGMLNCTPNPSTKPARGFYIDTPKGDIIFTPTKCDDVGVVALETTEYRKDTSGKWLIVGKTRRDIQLIVKSDCGYNNAPTIVGSFNNQVCEGEKICFNIDGLDATFTPNQTIPDTVTLTWNGAIPGATFTILNPKDREKTAQFCWQTKVGQGRDASYSFTVKATDNHCPKPSVAIRGFKIRVCPRATATRQYSRILCDKFTFSGSALSGVTSTLNYKWVLKDTLGDTVLVSAKQKDTTTIKKPGRYLMYLVVNNLDNCPTSFVDTVYIKAASLPVVQLRDTGYNQQDLKAPMANSIIKPQPSSAVKIKWTVLKAPAGVDSTKVLYEDPVGSQKYWMRFNNVSDSGRYTMQYCVTDIATQCESCDTSWVKIKANTSGVSQLHRNGFKLDFWPNPLYEGSWVISKTTRDAQFRLYSSEGKLISNGEIKKGMQTTINADKLNPGIYHLVVRQNDNVVMDIIKLVKL
ncbi:MAG: T9SS type A sorting domain-containing protein [Sphingomonadales bacterium]